MSDLDHRTPLQIALAEACDFAKAHGVDNRIDPDDFAIQRSKVGHTNATYTDAEHVVNVVLDSHGRTAVGVAELNWVHWPASGVENPDDEDCDTCNPGAPEPIHFRGVPLTTVHLPSDAPEAENAHASARSADSEEPANA